MERGCLTATKVGTSQYKIGATIGANEYPPMLEIPSKEALKPNGVGVSPDTRRGCRTSQQESFHPADYQFFAGAPFVSGMMTNETTTEPEAEFVCVSLGGEEASVFLRFARRCKIPEAKLPTRTRLRTSQHESFHSAESSSPRVRDDDERNGDRTRRQKNFKTAKLVCSCDP